MSPAIGSSKATVDELYVRKHPGSAERFQQALRLFPNGATHDGRAQQPFPLYITHAQGAHKWDVDGNEFIDFLVGHGALLLGHAHPEVTRAAAEQLQRGTHFGAAHELEIAWGQQVQRLIPSAERLRFTSSGTEATMMALRLARGFTGKSKIIKFAHHFHGWHDYAQIGPATDPPPHGIPAGTAASVVVLPANNIQQVEDTLKADPDIAAVILEPTGASWATYPLDPDFVPQLRRLTRHYGVLLILDEVITGFRVGPGGFQGESGVIPDLTCLAKILAGGLPGGAVAGRADILDLLAFKDDPEWNKRRKFRHQGTFNANPVSAAAGTTALRIVAEGWPTRYVNELAALLRAEMNKVMESHHLSGCVYGTYSMFHILPYNPHNPYEKLDPNDYSHPFLSLRDANPVLYGKLRRGMQVHGVDLMSDGGMLSIAHTEADVRQAAQALDTTLGLLKAEGAIPGVQ